MPRGLGTVTPYRGRWRARASIAGQRVSVGTYDTEEVAQGALAEFWRLRVLKQPSEPGLLTVSEWGKQYLDDRETDGVHRSVHRDRSVWRARIDGSAIGAEAVDSLTPLRVRAWLKLQIREPSLRTGKRPAPQTVANALNLLRVALEAAVDAGHCEINPVRHVRMPKIARDEEGWEWLRTEEVERVLTMAAPLEVRRIFTVAIFTGLRQGELWGLRWEDVDLKRRELRVSRSYAIPTKGGRVRRVPLLEPAWKALSEQPRRSSLVFPLQDLQMRHRGDDAGWRAIHEILGLRKARFHDLRHTCASHLVQGTWLEPLRLEDVRVWMGHRTIRTTERYAHLCPDGLLRRVHQSGLDRTRADSAPEVAMLETVKNSEDQRRGRDSNSCMTVLQTAPQVSNLAEIAPVSPIWVRAEALIETFGRGERPRDDDVVRVLAESAAELKKRARDEATG